jgi:F-type H+-transporting ATPase subunit epsilon
VSDSSTFGAELVTPEAVLFSGPATAVVLRTSEGDLTVLGGHTPLVGDVVSFVVRIERPDEATGAFCVHGGFVQVATAQGAAVGLVEDAAPTERSTRVTLLAGIAEPVGAVDVARAEAARDRAVGELGALASRDDDEAAIERAAAEGSLARAELRLGAAQGAAGAERPVVTSTSR